MKYVTFVLIVLYLLFGQVSAIAQNESLTMPTQGTEYGYYYKDKLIILNPSKNLLAIEDTGTNESFGDLVGDMKLIRDPLSDDAAIKNNGLALYRMSAPTKGKITTQSNLTFTIQSFAQSADRIIQPVFEQGPALLIPSDEVIVGFKEATSLAEAKKYLTAHLDEESDIILREHRKNTFILTIDRPSNGRIYAVSQSLVGLSKVSFAEPNHIVVMLHDKDSSRMALPRIKGETVVVYSGPSLEADALLAPHINLTGDMAAVSDPQWTTISYLDFESSSSPFKQWEVRVFTGSPIAYWGKTTFRAHGGSSSIYCAGFGSEAVSPPGPAPTNMGAILRSPVFNLAEYEEVYVEVWFYAKNEVAPDQQGIMRLWDYPVLFVYDADNTDQFAGQYLGHPLIGDCTTDPTTQNGWRKLLFRVPPALRVARAQFEFLYTSDGSEQFEGAYLDDIRIVATRNIDTNVLGNDTYGARQYELKNVGQIAGLGSEGNDLHIPEAWDLISVSEDVVVAVIDTGVDLDHDDLNLGTGYDYNGDEGGEPRMNGNDPPDAHGTACAGNVGAIRDNGIGVIGTAPGIKIMPIYWGSTIANIANAIDVAVSHGAHILSNSWSLKGAPSSDIENAIKSAINQNRVVLFSAGNGPDGPPFDYDIAYDVRFPCNLTGESDVICVGASSPTDEHKGAASSDGQHFWGSNYTGDGPDIVAPGTWSYTTDIQGEDGSNDGSLIDPGDASSADYNPSFGGTSSSTPKVAGIVALMLSKNPNLTPAQVKNILRSTADDIDVPGDDDKTGAGRVNAYQAVLNAPPPTEEGSLRVTILPSGAVDAGAQWRVDEEPWQNSGATYSGLSVGPHTVDFKEITGWTKPASQVVTITANQSTNYIGTYAELTGDQPNIIPYKPSSWSDKIVISNVTGTTTETTPLSPTDTIYVDWAIENNGTAAVTSAFPTTLYLDGVEKKSWMAESLDLNTYAYIRDFSLGSLAAGTHDIRIVADSDNSVVESNENDNSYTKTIMITEANLLENGSFESGHVAWSETNSAGLDNINYYAGRGHNQSDWYVYTGTENDLTSSTSQVFVIPNNAQQVYAQFWHKISTTEFTTSEARDSMTVQIINPDSGSVIDTLQTFSNLDKTSNWVESPQYDLSDHKGQSIRLNFHVETDSWAPTHFRVDDVQVTAITAEQYPLTVTKVGTGDGTITASTGVLNWNGDTGTANYDLDTVVTLTATPDSGSTFTGWSGACSGTGTCTATMDAPCTVTATLNVVDDNDDPPQALPSDATQPDTSSSGGGGGGGCFIQTINDKQ